MKISKQGIYREVYLGLVLGGGKGREVSKSGQLEKSSWDRVSVDIKHGTGKVPSLSWT